MVKVSFTMEPTARTVGYLKRVVDYITAKSWQDWYDTQCTNQTEGSNYMTPYIIIIDENDEKEEFNAAAGFFCAMSTRHTMQNEGVKCINLGVSKEGSARYLMNLTEFEITRLIKMHDSLVGEPGAHKYAVRPIIVKYPDYRTEIFYHSMGDRKPLELRIVKEEDGGGD